MGAWNTVGAGSVVVRDLPPGMLAMGTPCLVVRGGRPPARLRGVRRQGGRRPHPFLSYRVSESDQYPGKSSRRIRPSGTPISLRMEVIASTIAGGPET